MGNRATINIIKESDDLRLMVKKINDNFRQIAHDQTITNVTKGGEGTDVHNELTGRDALRCHPSLAISGTQPNTTLADELEYIMNTLEDLDEDVQTLKTTVATHTAKIADHERRIRALEER